MADLPLFIDPFLLFNSDKNEYQQLHDEMIKYLSFLRHKAVGGSLSTGLINAWYRFPEIKQTWLGFSASGNRGSGLGPKFATELHRNLHRIFSDFGTEKITKGSHLEKLCLIGEGVGKDNISDFATNLIHGYLLHYTQEFARSYIRKKLLRRIRVPKVQFNYATETLIPDTYTINVEAKGFKKAIARDIVISVSRNIQVNVQLEIGLAGESVTVTAAQEVINIASPSLTNVISTRQVVDLPLQHVIRSSSLVFKLVSQLPELTYTVRPLLAFAGLRPTLRRTASTRWTTS